MIKKKQKYFNLTSTLFLLTMTMSISNNIFSQVKIGDNPKSINSDAMLEVESTSKGILLPRIALKSTTSSFPLKSFTAGMIIYNTDLNCIQFHNGTTWKCIEPECSSY